MVCADICVVDNIVHGVLCYLGGTISPLSFYYIFAHIHAMDLIYSSKCSPFNVLPNGMFYLAIYAFVYKLQVEISLI